MDEPNDAMRIVKRMDDVVKSSVFQTPLFFFVRMLDNLPGVRKYCYVKAFVRCQG